MLNSFISGALAGYAIAIPVGVIAILILETGLQRGFWHSWAAGTGAATADLIYATIAATLGTLVALWLTPIAPFLRLASAGFLIALGARGVVLAWRARQAPENLTSRAIRASIPRTYLTLLGLTLLNPATIAYFAALILGGTVGTSPSTAEKAAFAVGAFLASWSWQSFLAALSAVGHHHLPPGFRVWSGMAGNLIVIVLGIVILF